MKFGKRFISLALVLVMIFSLTTGASAATAQNIKVQLSPNITVTYNGKVQSMKDAAGNPVYPLLNGGTTYLPVRAVANMLGVAVEWDGATSTVLLADPPGGRKPTGSTGDAGKKPAPSTITVQLSPGVSVNYNGKAQTMADVNGNPVYPLMYEGTTYLPIRAVSNMLGVAVDWDGSTQTVLLGKKSTAIITNSNGVITVTVNDPTEENIRNELKAAGISDDDINMCVVIASFGQKDYPIKFTIDNRPGAKHKYRTDIVTNEQQNANKTAINKFKNSDDAEILGKNHIGYDYAEIDWSTANDGYIRVKLNKQLGKFTTCTMDYYDSEYNKTSHKFILPADKWYNIPLYDGSNEYFVTIQTTYSEEDIKNLPQDEWDAIARPDLKVRFKAEIKNKNAWLTLSSGQIDYENAPNTCAKALELTENCKTDAEKVKAVFDWVAKNIKYDHKLANEINAYTAKLDANKLDSRYNLFLDGARENLNPDDILASKSGVCEDYATLTVAMLRSLGIPCKYVSGNMYNTSSNKWVRHGWVAIDPSVTGLSTNTLHGWKDAEGWVNIDPTNVIKTPNLTSKASNYKAESEY